MASQLLKLPTTSLRRVNVSISYPIRSSSIQLRSSVAPFAIVRPFHLQTAYNLPRKGAEDKDSINREPTEYSKSGTDDQAAAQEEAAFDPNDTNPESEKKTAGEGNDGRSNPLDVSPANPEVSKQQSPTEGGAEKSSSESGAASDRGRTSGGGSPNKGKKVS